MGQNVQEFIRELAFFQHVDAEQLPAIEAAGTVREVSANTLLFSEGDAAQELFLIISGAVEIFKPQAEMEQHLAIMRAGECFGEIALVEGGARTASVKTLEDSQFFVLSQDAFFPLLTRSPRLLSQVIGSVSQKMRQANQERYEQELKARTRELEQERQRQLMLQQLVTGIAHEFNTPLGILKTTSSLLAEENDPELHSEACELITSHVERMGFLVETMKAISPRELYIQPTLVSWQEYLPNFELHYQQSSYRNLALDMQIDEALAGDFLLYPDALDEVLMHVLLNIEMHAYPEADGDVILRLQAAPYDPQMLQLCVIDQGAGIPEPLRERVQTPFFTTQRMTGAVGLGLTIAENIMHTLFGGSLKLVHPESGGLCVVLSFSKENNL